MHSLNLYSKIEPYLDFHDEVQELYDAFFQICEELAIASLIDIGCGQGEFLLSLKPLGIETFGTDLSSEQIRVCQSKGLQVACQDIDTIDQKFQCATAIFDVLNYMEKTTLEKFIKNCEELLLDEGYFLFDINTLYGFEEVADGSLQINHKDRFIAIDANYANKKLATTIVLFEKNTQGCYEKSEDTIIQHFHEKNTIKKLLEKSNFVIKQIINFHLHSEEKPDKLLFICQKRAKKIS